MQVGQISRNPSTREYQEYLRLNGQISKVKKDMKRTALRDLRARWVDSVDHDEIKQQLKGEAASAFACQTRVWLFSEDLNLRRILFRGYGDGTGMVRYCACAVVCPQFAKAQDPQI